MKITESTNSDEGAEYIVRCLACQNDTRHHVALSLTRNSDDSDWWWIAKHQIIQCRGCDSPTFRYERIDPDSEQLDSISGAAFVASEVALYPSRATKAEIENARFLPDPIQNTYREVLRAIAGNTPVLGAIGLRTLIEAACVDLGQTGTLKGMIDGLVSGGKLRPEEAEVLHSLRKAGNLSAHEHHALTQEQLLHALRMVEHILTAVYLLPHHRHNLP